MICHNCKDVHTGQTGDELRHIIPVHRQQIKTDNLRLLSVSKHIRHCVTGSFEVFQMYQMFSQDTI